jgi:hypothetical protein
MGKSELKNVLKLGSWEFNLTLEPAYSNLKKFKCIFMTKDGDIEYHVK